MPHAITLTRTGPPDAMALVPVDRADPGPGQAWIDHEAIGVNYLDVTQRRGEVPIPLPSGLGLEGAGRVAALGAGVQGLQVGDRVAYALGPLGSYATGRLLPAERLVRIPDGITAEAAAATVFKGITAHYLLHRTYAVGAGSLVLLYGAAGGLGQILAPWARQLGATVVGVVSKAASVETARAAGCDAVLVWGTDDLPGQLVRAAGRKADVVYDGVGRLSFATSLDCLRPRGTMVSIGASSGVPEPVALGTLNAKGSLFLTRPGLAAHASDVAEYRARVQAVFEAVQRGTLAARVARRFALAEAAQAHAALEQGQAGGSVVLLP